MQVKIKDFTIDMDVKANGIEFEVRTADGSAQLGDCYLTMTGLIWCPGRTTKANGVKIAWDDFISIMSSMSALRAAVGAAKAINKT